MRCSRKRHRNLRTGPFIRAVVLAFVCAGCSVAYAHKASDAFLDLRLEDGALAVRWDIALRDLDQVLDLDRNGNGTLEWGEIEQQQPVIQDYALKAIRLATGAGPCRQTSVAQELARRSDGAYAVLRWRADCPELGSNVDIRYRFLMDIDPTHRAIVSVPGAELALRTLRPSADAQAVSLRPAQPGGGSYDLAGFFVEGFRHILYGVDHLAFLLALLIPSVAVAAAGNRRLGSTLAELLTIVSVFTLAHSITLGLTALHLISLPSRLVESLVALSVVVAGVQAILARNATPGQEAIEGVTSAIGGSSRWQDAIPLWLVFAFGLIHGIGFGSALNSAGFGGRSALSALFGFNIGVEAGQLGVLAVVFPLAWALRKTAGFKRLVLPALALAIVVFGVVWFLSRAFNIDIASMLLPG